MSQIRAFLAIDLDDDLKPKINKIIREFKKTDARIKYVELANLHLTLKFFGDIDTEGLGLLEEAIANVVSQSIIKDLHDKLDKEFVRLGFDKDKRFSTHLTIGRMKSAKGKDKVKSTIEEFSDVEIGEMEVDHITLKKSTLTPAGPIYEDLKIFEL